MADVIVFGDGSSLDAELRELAELGLAIRVAMTAGEVIWLLEEDSHRFVAIVIDGDRASPDRFELLAYLRDHQPHLNVLMMLTAPAVSELDGCVVVDKHALRDRVATAKLAWRHDE